MNKKELIAELEKLGMRPGRGLGQNFLLDGNLLDWIVRASGVAQGENILEVGPGFGALTGRLVASGVQLTAVEFDHRLAEYNREKFASPAVSTNVRITASSVPLFVKLAKNLDCKHRILKFAASLILS